MKTSDIIKNVLEIIEQDSDHNVFGIRTCNKDYQIGDMCDNSHVWDDGEWTNEELDGVCCTGIPMYPEESDIKKCLRYHIIDVDTFGPQFDFYDGEHTYLIGGDGIEYGTDEGEYIISGGTVIGILK